MKRYMHIPTIITVALIIVLAVGGILLWSGLNKGSGTQAEGTTESTTPTTAPAPVEDYSNLMLDDYDLPIDNSTINDETIYQILSYADQILSQYKIITVKRTEYHNRFIQYYRGELSDYVTIEEYAITINADRYTRLADLVENPSVHYFVFISLISNEYANCIAEYDFDDYGLNRVAIPTLAICPDFKDAGYESAQNYYDAWWDDECELLSPIYEVSLGLKAISDSGSLTNHYDEYINKRAKIFNSIGCNVIKILSIGENKPISGNCEKLIEELVEIGSTLQ